MNISWQWLNELVDLQDITPENLAEQLTLASFEVESITKNIHCDTIINISTTSNRADTLSIVGIVREIAAIIKKPPKKQYIRFPFEIQYKNILDTNNPCKHHIYTSIFNVKIESSPKWLQIRLKNHDIQPQNNIIDILNFIYIKWGQSIEVYDLNKIEQEDITNLDIECILKQQSGIFIDRNNINIKLPNKPLAIIQNKNNTLGLAGICNSKASQIDNNTRNLLIQTTTCNIKYIQSISKLLNISTKESILQKNNINESDLLSGYNEAILLITYLAQGIPQQTRYNNISSIRYIYNPIYINQQNIIDILGPQSITSISESPNNLNLDVANILLHHLQLVAYRFDDYIQVNIPLSRIDDLSRTIDIIEELIRIYGFDKFIDQIPSPLNCKYGTKEISQYRISHIRSILRSLGMHETIHSSLINNNDNKLKIYNPLTEEFNALRDHLIHGLLESYRYNINKGNGGIEIFETGRIFNKNQDINNESIHLAGLIGGESSNRSNWADKPLNITWFQAKGQLEEFFERINIEIIWQKVDKNWFLYKNILKYFHPKNIAMLYSQKKPIGIFGEINCDFTDEMSKKIYGFEIIMNHLPLKDYQANTFTEYSKYPSIIRDIKINIKQEMLYTNILKKIRTYKDPLIESIDLFDVYPNGQKHKDIGLRITYQSQKTTLINSEIDELEDKLKRSILSDLILQ